MTEQQFTAEFYSKISEIMNRNPTRYRDISFKFNVKEFYPQDGQDPTQALRDLISLWRDEATEYDQD